MAGIPTKNPKESLVKRFFETINSGNFYASGSELLDSVLEEIALGKERN